MTESSEIAQGEVIQWYDNKGYGFITKDNDKEKIFFHISCVKNKIRRPQVGDLLSFIVKKDKKGRWQAEDILITNLAEEENITRESNPGKFCKTRKITYSAIISAIIMLFGAYVWIIWL